MLRKAEPSELGHSLRPLSTRVDKPHGRWLTNFKPTWTVVLAAARFNYLSLISDHFICPHSSGLLTLVDPKQTPIKMPTARSRMFAPAWERARRPSRRQTMGKVGAAARRGRERSRWRATFPARQRRASESERGRRWEEGSGAKNDIALCLSAVSGVVDPDGDVAIRLSGMPSNLGRLLGSREPNQRPAEHHLRPGRGRRRRQQGRYSSRHPISTVPPPPPPLIDTIGNGAGFRCRPHKSTNKRGLKGPL